MNIVRCWCAAVHLKASHYSDVNNGYEKAIFVPEITHKRPENDRVTLSVTESTNHRNRAQVKNIRNDRNVVNFFQYRPLPKGYFYWKYINLV